MLKISYIRYILLFILLVLIQVVVLNKVSFLVYAIPFVYIYFILKLPVKIDRNLLLLLGFVLGFIIDIFCNTMGINTAATTLVAFIRQPVMQMFYMSDGVEEEIPGISTMGTASFLKYAISLIFIHVSGLVLLESFSILSVKLILLRILASTVLSTLLIYGFEGLTSNAKITNSGKRSKYR